MTELDKKVAHRIVEQVGGSGQPPEYGLQYFTAGLDDYLTVIDREYLGSFIQEGGSAFKMVVGVYGGGKTHFLYCVRDLAWRHNFVVSYVSLKLGESPFHQLDLVYKAVVRGLLPPLSAEELLSGYEKGIVSFLRSWYAQRYQRLQSQGLSGERLQEELLHELESIEGVESISFGKAVESAFRALINHAEEDFINICQWLGGEGYERRVHREYGILQRIDKTTAFSMLRSLVQWIRQIGYSGLVILLDEAERMPSLTSKQHELHLSNLRELIDECGHSNFQRVMILYAVPDENFLQGRTQVYEALRQRLATSFDVVNSTGVKIELEKVGAERLLFLHEIGRKLAHVYEVAFDYKFEPVALQMTIDTVADAALEKRFGDISYKRLFVQSLVSGLHFLRNRALVPSAADLNI